MFLNVKFLSKALSLKFLVHGISKLLPIYCYASHLPSFSRATSQEAPGFANSTICGKRRCPRARRKKAQTAAARLTIWPANTLEAVAPTTSTTATVATAAVAAAAPVQAAPPLARAV